VVQRWTEPHLRGHGPGLAVLDLKGVAVWIQMDPVGELGNRLRQRIRVPLSRLFNQARQLFITTRVYDAVTSAGRARSVSITPNDLNARGMNSILIRSGVSGVATYASAAIGTSQNRWEWMDEAPRDGRRP